MTFLTNEDSAIRFQSCLLLSVFLLNLESINSKDIISILGKNKFSLAQVVCKIKTDGFDEPNEISVDELILIIKKLPVVL